MELRVLIFDLDGSLDDPYDAQGREIYLMLLRLIDGMEECLDWLKARGIMLFLVTKGERHEQEKKIACLGLERWFDEKNIIIAEPARPRVSITSVKFDELIKLVDKKLVEEMGIPRDAIGVLGDRRDDEIRWGNFLECVTIRMCRSNGKHRNREPDPRYNDEPDFEVSNGFELMQLPIFA